MTTMTNSRWCLAVNRRKRHWTKHRFYV